MQVSDLTIQRPVFASVISLLLCVAGLAGLSALPVREYPAVDPPVVSISTAYKGASNEVIESRVTEVIERAVAGIEGITNISSFSQNDRSSISVEFDVGRDPDAAAADVRDRVGRVLARLPDGADAPVIQRIDSNAQAIMWIGVTSNNLDALELTDFLRRVVVDRLATVPGVASVNIGGERRFAMRIQIDRTALAARGVTVLEVEQAIRRQNVDLPGGRLTSNQRELTIKTDSKLGSAEEFARIVIASRNGYQVRLGEVARVEVGAEDERFEFFAGGKTAIGLGIIRQSTANTLSVAEAVAAELELLRPAFPEGTTAQVLYNEANFIRASINGVLTTLAEGIALVVLVILVFLRDWRSTLVATTAIPVSIIPTFAVLWMFGFSINVLTLLAVVLAIGIVVDDAIVEVENVHRRIEEGEPPLLASFIGAREIGFAVIATTITLMSVFVPIAFMSGQTGQLFREFGITLATAIFFSGVVARTLTPMLCSKLLTQHHGWVHRVTEPAFAAMNRGYRSMLRGALAAPLIVIAVGVVISAAAVQLFAIVPKEFAPVEDRGTIIIPITAPESASLSYTRERVKEVEAMLKPYADQGVISTMLTIVAPGLQRPAPVNSGLIIARLAPWEARSIKQQHLQQQLLARVQAVPGARVFPINPPSLGQRGFQQPLQFIIGGPDFPTLAAWRDIVLEKANAAGIFRNLDSDYNERQPDLRVRIDRARAADLGIAIDDIGRSLELMFGEREVSTFVDRGIEYLVIMQARQQDRMRPDDLKNVFVKTSSGQLVPLSNLVTLAEIAGPQRLNRNDRLRSITIQGSLAPGVTLGQGLDTLDRIARENLPAEARISYGGQSKEYRRASSSLAMTFGFALLVVFLVLAAQFESWIAPAVIMVTVPLALTGALAILVATGQTLNVYSQIGMILLIGIMTKNGILIVEFTNQLRERGLSVYDAVLEASEMRLRPILMTSIATICGAVPLAVSTGAGAEARSTIGWVIIGGSGLSTLMTLFLVPAVFLLVGRFSAPRSTIAERIAELQERFARRDAKPEEGGARAHPAE
ncbi:efflux RND transporter permease subunit [Rhabdaerophilum calidifontis]|uniref:efflux RND transporter permease subunit n=1 Tax=Rhabdaerophilum calidifontis TaxID=2604328 RepID=UPI0012399228|nr:efflux RND transporter permease subunit [Rhabdaerophilum calidifontis]